MRSRVALSILSALLIPGSLAFGQSITVERAEIASGADATSIRATVNLDLPAATRVDVEIRRPGVTVVDKVLVDAPGRKELTFGPFPAPSEPGLYPIFFSARKQNQTDAGVKQAWVAPLPDVIEGSFSVVVGDPQEAARLQAERQKKYLDLLFRYGKWYQQETQRIEGAIGRAAEVQKMSQGDPMRFEHFRKTLWESSKGEGEVGKSLFQPIHHDLLRFKGEEEKVYAPNFGPLCAEIAATDEALNGWFGAIMKEAQATYEKLSPTPGGAPGKEGPEVHHAKRMEFEAKIKSAAEHMYQTLGSDIAAAWVMREVMLVDRGVEDKGIYKNQSCRFLLGPLPKGLRFNLFSSDPSLRVFLEPDEDPTTKKVPAHLVGFQCSVAVRQFAAPLAADAFANILGAGSEGFSQGSPLSLDDKLMPGGKRRGMTFRQSVKQAGNAVQPAGDYEGVVNVLYGRDSRTIYFFQAIAQKQFWPKCSALVDEIWKTFKVRDEDPPQLIQLVPR